MLKRSGWGEAQLSDLYLLPSRNGISVPKSTRGSGTPMMNMSELFSQDIVSSTDEWEMVPVSETQRDRFALQNGDLVFGRRSLTRAGAGKVSIIANIDCIPVFESSLIRVRLNQTLACPEFFFHYFRSSLGRSNMEQIVEQVAVSGIRSSDLGRLKVPLPDVSEQRRIASILSTFDDLIETNRELSRDLLSLMFSRYAELGRNTSVTTFGNVAHLVRDQWKPGDDGPNRYLGLEHFGTDGTGLKGTGNTDNIQSASLRFHRGDVLYGKLRPYFRKVARPGFAGLCSSEVWVLRAQEDYSQSFIHSLAHAASFSEFASAGSTGTRMPRADWKHVSMLLVPDLRTDSIPTAVSAGLETLWTAACDLEDECEDLARQRDEILPLLMSGKVQVRNLEGAV
ncbi:restriction endonuclease subunit S [Dietzia natronolimnaea]|uniref:restriction endonuclease subunit S n=1 Tax=Dietzia natronolimnaea TaxID=161920 RepID=UPI003D099587|nr:hypothetical protein [Dietzia sp. SLG510A3-40A3]